VSIFNTGEIVHQQILNANDRKISSSFRRKQNTGPEPIVDQTQGQRLRHRDLERQQQVVVAGVVPSFCGIRKSNNLKKEKFSVKM
jgi:hypothetical protein